MSIHENICPHGHPLVYVDLPNGFKQAVGGYVKEHPLLEEGMCPLCEERGWKGVPFKINPPTLSPPTFVTNPEPKKETNQFGAVP